MRKFQARGYYWFLASLLTLGLGVTVAARHFPGGFDWRYTVASALASRADNPAGSVWYAIGLSLSMALLWPYVTALKKELYPSLPASAGRAFVALRAGLVCGVLLGLEGFLLHDLSHWITKGHELLGIVTFLGLFSGVLGLLILVMRRQRIYAVPAIMVAGPLVIIGITQFWLYLEQREIGWVGTNWSAMETPLWLSFAFWQWLAMGFLAIGLGLLSFIGRGSATDWDGH